MKEGIDAPLSTISNTANTASQVATFNHTFQKPGLYNVKFAVDSFVFSCPDLNLSDSCADKKATAETYLTVAVNDEQSSIVGTIQMSPISVVAPQGCGYCFTSDDGKYNCSLMAGKNFSANSDLTIKDLSMYLNKKVVIKAKGYTGPSTIKCPISLDVDQISLK